jgi:mannonate dehydratase
MGPLEALMSTHPTRREFAALAASAATSTAAAAPAKRPLDQWDPGVKVSLQIPTDPKPEDIQFVQQLGVHWVNIPTGGTRATYETFAEVKARVEAAGLKVWNIGNSNVHNMPEVTLNLPGREQKIEEYKQYLRNLAKAGIFYTTYAHMGNGIWSSPQEITRGGAKARALDLKSPDAKGYWIDKVYEGPLTHGRKYTEQEIWDNYEYFIRQVVPVAEELGIRIGIHPDDPPAPELGGIPRCIFSNFNGYKRALEIANSPCIGVCLCVGCWLEGGTLMGKTPVETIQYFGKQRKLFKVHFRNVNRPLPHFVETFIDNGYAEMYPIMRALVEVDFRGAVIADHVPAMIGHRNVGWAYSIAYMKAMLDRANAEVRKT